MFAKCGNLLLRYKLLQNTLIRFWKLHSRCQRYQHVDGLMSRCYPYSTKITLWIIKQNYWISSS